MVSRQKSSAKKSPAKKSSETVSTSKSYKTRTADELSSQLKSILQSSKLSKSPVTTFKDSGFASPLLFVGPEALRIKRIISWLKENLFSEQSIRTYFGSELNAASHVDRLSNDLRHSSLFATCPLVILYDVDAIKANLLAGVVQGVKSLAPSTFLVMTAGDLQKKHALGDLAQLSTVVQFSELKGAALATWVQREVTRNGIRGGIAQDALQLLMEVFGNDTLSLSQEIAKFSLLVSGDEQLTRAHILPILNKSPEKNSFELFHAISAKNAVRAAQLTTQLMDQGLHPLQINSFLSRCVRTLLAHVDHPSAVTSTELGNPWFLRNLSNDRLRFTAEDLVSSVRCLKDLDFTLKSSQLPHPLALSLAVEQVALRRFDHLQAV